MKKTLNKAKGALKYVWNGHLIPFAGGANLSGGGSSVQTAISAFFDPATTSLSSMINTLFYFAIVIGAILAVIRLVFAGFKYMTTDMWGSKGDAKVIIQQALLGLLLLLAVYLILFQINPQILDLEIIPPASP